MATGNPNAYSRSVPAAAVKGIAERTTGTAPARAADSIKNGTSKTATDPKKSAPSSTKFFPSLVKNPLEKFASFAPMWTLACLTPKQFNDPSSYRNNQAVWANDSYKDSTGKTITSSVVFSSGGRFDSQRAKTASGIPEYYIQNFTMKATVAANEKTGNSNAFGFDFEIFEPFSMGLLLQSLQVSARNAGYINYLDNAPYVLKLDFMGFDETGIQLKSVKPKFFVLRLTGVKYTVNESGSTYKMTAVPYNHQGFSDIINVAYTDLKLKAAGKGTVEEILSTGPDSLQSILNKNEAKLVSDKRIGVADEYVISFPKSSSDFQSVSKIPGAPKRATSNPKDGTQLVVSGGRQTTVKTDFDTNEIAPASLGFSQASGGTMPFKRPGDQYDEKTGVVKRDNMTIDTKNREFQFTQAQTLTSIINQIIVSSKYARDAITSVKNIKDGFIKWYRLDVQIELLDFDPIISDFAKRITYRVVPFYVHHTIFTNPSSLPVGYPEIQKKLVKKYDYLYTGQNVDVLKFDVSINNMFFTGIAPAAEKDSAKATNKDQGGTAEKTNSNTKAGNGGSVGAQTANLGRARPKRTLPKAKFKGGSGDTTTEQEVAEQFHEAFINGAAELVTVYLEILGDPYWMVDSGQGNYFATTKEPTAQITDDGTMNYESGDVFVQLGFRSPIDVNEYTGLYDFPKESPFSGIYRVTMCENQFKDGQFIQKLTCIRMPGQAVDYKDLPPELRKAPDLQNAVAVKITEAEKIKSGPTDSAPPLP